MESSCRWRRAPRMMYVCTDTPHIRLTVCRSKCDLAVTIFQAQISFSKQRAKPGEEVDIELKASAGSLCSYGIVDKSVFLEGGDNQLTLDKALNKIQQFNLREWSGYGYYFRLSHCRLSHLHCFICPLLHLTIGSSPQPLSSHLPSLCRLISAIFPSSLLLLTRFFTIEKFLQKFMTAM